MVHVVLLLLVAYGTDDLEGPHDTISYYGSYNSYGANGFTCLMNDLYDFLKGFYAQDAALVQVQEKQPAGPPPPSGFSEYKKNAAAGGVMGMIQQAVVKTSKA